MYAGASDQLRAFATATGIPVADTHAGKGAINWDHPSAVGGVGSTGTSAANTLAPVSYTHLDVYKRQGLDLLQPDPSLHGVEVDPDAADAQHVEGLGGHQRGHLRCVGRAREALARVLSVPDPS